MGDYSVSNFSFNKGKSEYNGQKKTTFDLTKFDGVSKDELIRRAGGANTQQGKLIASIFNKYDGHQGDGILTKEEYQQMQADLVTIAHDGNLGGNELKKFNETLGLDKKAYSMEDLQAVVGMMVDGSDAVTTDAEGNILVKTSEEGVGTTTAKYQQVDDPDNSGKKKLVLLSDSVVNGNTTTVTEYIDGDKNKRSKTTETTGDTVTTTIYADNGTDIQSRTCVRGSVIEELDPANGDRVTKKTTDRGTGGKEIIEYSYDSEGNVTETYKDTVNGDKPTKIIKKDAQGNVISTKTFEYKDDKVTELEVTGSGDDAVRVRTERNEKGKLVGQVNVDAEDTVQDAKHTVEPGQTWYNIVQAKYGVTDHRTTMEIVRQLKTLAREEHGQFTWIPKEITLPGTITLKSGDTVSLKNTGALVQQNATDANGNSVGPRITPPHALTSAQMPQAIEPLTADQQKVTLPTFEVKPENAKKFIKQDDGQYYYYNADGRVTHIYANEADKNARNNSHYIEYDDQGKITLYKQNTYDAQGHYTGTIEYDGTGAFTDRWVNDQFDPKGQKGCQTHYNADGGINYIIANYQYDDQGRMIAYDNFNADGSWVCSRKLDYGNDGTCQARYYDASDRGRMTEIESFK